LTWDQGKEMALHAQVAGTLEMPVFLCQKASPWQRPSNENTNGLLRQYFPQGTYLRVHTAERIAAVAAELNARPRKTLGWQTPAEQLDRITAQPTAPPRS
jgi:IS30 family transposase